MSTDGLRYNGDCASEYWNLIWIWGLGLGKIKAISYMVMVKTARSILHTADKANDQATLDLLT
jgi:hypothetical protein